MGISSRILLAALGAAAALGGCREQEPPADSNTAADEASLNLPSVPALEPALDRASFLAAVAEAASATAAGTPMPESVSSLDGRQFEIRIRFGCGGPSTALREESLGWSFDPESRTLRVRAMPTISAEEPLAAGFAGEESESIEGFWLARPWMLQPVCPQGAAVRAPEPTAETAEAETEAPATDQPAPAPGFARVGIAQYFTSQDARTRRRDSRAYEAVTTLPEGAALSSAGFDLVLSGRLQAMPGRSVIECRSFSASSPPECIASARFQRVWIEKPDSGELVAEWGSG